MNETAEIQAYQVVPAANSALELAAEGLAMFETPAGHCRLWARLSRDRTNLATSAASLRSAGSPVDARSCAWAR